MPVQSLSSTGQTLTGTFTAGNTLVVCAMVDTVAGSLDSITTSHSETLVLVDRSNLDAAPHVGTGAYLLNCVGGLTTITVNTTHGTAWNISCYEYAASDAASFDVHAVSAATTGTNPASGTTGTTSSANETVVGWLTEIGVSTPSAGSGYGNFIVSSSTNFAALEDKSVSSTGTQQATFTDPTSLIYRCGVMTFVKTFAAVSQPNYVISFW